MNSSGKLPFAIFQNDRYVGTISQVTRSSVRVEMSDVDESSAAEIGDFVVVACGELAVFGQLTDIQASGRPASRLRNRHR